MSFSELQGVTDVSVDDLNPGVAARLADGGIAVESLDAAWNLVDEYEQDAQRDSTTPDGGKTADDAAANTSANGSTASNGADNASSAAKPQTGAAQ